MLDKRIQDDLAAPTWGQRAKDQMAQLPTLWAQLRGRAAVPAGMMAYGAISTLALWPAVEAVTAAARAGQALDPFTLGAAVIGLTGSVGGNLIASHLYEWYQKTKEGEVATAEDILVWLQENQTAVQPALDELVEKTAVLEPALQAFGETQRGQFTQILRQELAALGNLPRFEKALDQSRTYGKGAVHVENSTIHGTIVGGSGNSVGNTTNHFYSQKGPDPDPSINLAPAPPNLHSEMVNYLSKSDITTICFYLDVDYDRLAGATLDEKVAALITDCRRKNRVADLLQACAQRNPSRRWG